MGLLADIVLRDHPFGQGTEPAAGSDAFVLMTLGFLGFLFGAVVAAGIVLWRRQTRPEPHRRLLMEMEQQDSAQQASATTGGDAESARQPWEREADWWKK